MYPKHKETLLHSITWQSGLKWTWFCGKDKKSNFPLLSGPNLAYFRKYYVDVQHINVIFHMEYAVLKH